MAFARACRSRLLGHALRHRACLVPLHTTTHGAYNTPHTQRGRPDYGGPIRGPFFASTPQASSSLRQEPHGCAGLMSLSLRLSENEDSSLLANFVDLDFGLQNPHRHFSRNFAEFGC
jgi:hypothetical protein